MFKQEKSSDRCRFASASFGGFEIRQESAANDGLKKLAQEVYDLERNYILTQQMLLLIEFSRPDYLAALSVFNKKLVSGSYFICIQADLPTCLQRNLARVQNGVSNGDNHYVPEQIIRAYYQDMYAVAEQIKSYYHLMNEQVLVIDSTKPFVQCRQAINDFALSILKREQHNWQLRQIQSHSSANKLSDATLVYRINGDTTENPRITTEGGIPVVPQADVSERDTEGMPKIASVQSPTPLEKNQLFAPMW